MKIFLLGYMGSGKSHLGKLLSQRFKCDFLDIDEEIEKAERTEISQIFLKKGEVYFRKLERKILESFINREDSFVAALGGGTPCYGNNMEIIKDADDVKSIYLKLNINTLTNRLNKEKEHRPMISHLDERESLEEFIRKHLFERSFYYNQADHVISCDSKEANLILDEIEAKLR